MINIDEILIKQSLHWKDENPNLEMGGFPEVLIENDFYNYVELSKIIKKLLEVFVLSDRSLIRFKQKFSNI